MIIKLFKPKWVQLLPSYARPDGKRISELEKLRVEFEIPHAVLAIRILSSPATTRRVQRDCLENFRAQNPGVSEKELFRMVFASRIQAREFHGFRGMTNQEIDQAMKDINSFDGLCEYIVSMEQESQHPDPFGIGKRIDEILAQEEIEKKAPAENLVKSLEQIYFDLRNECPNQDEHWLLAHTWLKKYGSTKQAKKKGPELMKFIAYKETLQFSILETPKSIRGLALFLVYKELGDKQAIYYNSEFSLIMEPIIKSIEQLTFLNKYKEKNPRVWKENQLEDESPYSLYRLLKGLEFVNDHYEGFEKLCKEIESRQNRK